MRKNQTPYYIPENLYCLETLTEQNLLGKKHEKRKIGLYDDDHFVCFGIISGSEAEIIRKVFVKISETEFNLGCNIYLYTNLNSNHPFNIKNVRRKIKKNKQIENKQSANRKISIISTISKWVLTNN